jgi:hypothetical protein
MLWLLRAACGSGRDATRRLTAEHYDSGNRRAAQGLIDRPVEIVIGSAVDDNQLIVLNSKSAGGWREKFSLRIDDYNRTGLTGFQRLSGGGTTGSMQR